MRIVVRYDAETRDLFDNQTQEILDSIQQKCPRVEIELPDEEKDEELFFVQVYRKGDDGMPEGFFGVTTYEAACSVAKALKIPDPND